MALKVTPRVVSPKPSFTAKIDGDALSAQITKDGIQIRRNEKGAAALRVSEAEFAELFSIVRALDEQLEDKKKLEQEWDRLNPIEEDVPVTEPDDPKPGEPAPTVHSFQDDGPTEDDTPAVLADDPADDTVARAKALLAKNAGN